MSQLLTNARVFDGETIRDNVDVIVADGLIQSIAPAGDRGAYATAVDLDGGLLAPGFIDLQVNGGGGVMFNDRPDADGLAIIVQAHRKFGTTGLLPTVISADLNTMRAAAEAVRDSENPSVLGIHFEGPHLNPAKRGIHGAEDLRPPTSEEMAIFMESSPDRVMVTLAPEVTGLETVRRLAAAGVRVCAGHSAASFDETNAAIKAGLTGFTHLFNAMPAMQSRDPGIVAAALLSPDTWCGLIVDGHHVDPAMLHLALRTSANCFLVTDAMACVGVDFDAFEFQGQAIRVEGGRCTTVDGTLAGSALDMASAVRNAVSLLDLPLEAALRMASLHPATFLGLDDCYGRVAPGYHADLVLLDDDLTVRATWIRGEREDG